MVFNIYCYNEEELISQDAIWYRKYHLFFLYVAHQYYVNIIVLMGISMMQFVSIYSQ